MRININRKTIYYHAYLTEKMLAAVYTINILISKHYLKEGNNLGLENILLYRNTLHNIRYLVSDWVEEMNICYHYSQSSTS